jgi:TolB protein
MFDLRGTVTTQLTKSSSIDVSPSYSPDGSQVVFCSNRGGGPQIYIMGADGSSPRRVSFADSNYCTSPAWSPKGDKIVFVCRQAGFQLFMSGPEGGSAVQLTFAGDNEDPSWSPDGRFIAFSSTTLGGGGKSIGILSLLGGKPTRISQSKGIDSQPAWSPLAE